MPSMYSGINSYSSIGDRKYTSGRISLELGEKFSGRITKLNKETNQVLIKILDGTEIFAAVDGELMDDTLKELSKFEVIQLDNGKIKLKILNKDESNKESINGNNSPKRESVGESLISKILNYNIPNSKENVMKIHSILDFLNRIKTNESEVDKFIKNILNAKEISEGSVKGNEIKGILKDFLISFKSMNEGEVLTFIENNIEFTKENIEAYKKVFNENNGLNNIIASTEKDILNIVNEDKSQLIDDKLNRSLKEINISENKEFKNKEFENKVIVNENKFIDTNNEKTIKKPLNQIIRNVTNIESNNIDNSDVNCKALEERIIKEIKYEIKNSIFELNNNKASNIKDSINKIISKVLGVEITLNDKDLDSIIKDLKNTYNIDLLKENINNKEGINKISKEPVKVELKNEGLKTENNETTKLASKLETKVENKLETKVENKLENKVENVNIHKDDNIKVEIQKRDIPKGEVLTNEIIKEQIKENTNNIKDIIKGIISNVKDAEDGIIPNRIMEVISKNIDSFKIFNNISENYYYMDIPLNLQENTYQCKLVVKDDRSKGKNIDSKNMKMIVTVATVNMGNIDSYLIIKDKNLQVDIKCNKEYVKMLEGGSRVLSEKILKMGLIPNITVKEKIEEVSLNNCNMFFNDTTISELDIKV